jgi:nucleoside-diphosphate kinase
MERTLAIIKPDAVARKFAGDILKRIETAGLRLCALKLMHLTSAQAQLFYEVHKDRPFYESLCSYMSSGPVVIAVLAGEGAIARWRELMGATDPAKAAAGTIRKDFGIDVETNAAHGSDAAETATREIGFFFNTLELVG